ncbi:hypothetical protein SAY87_027657 [Trapa incisa]|uniref:BHLH domain-containing protein n=1 Tax=Trapa incisa TaxID=236973 RepID=A0AAN7JNE6_9MYRT|nr:hypothetical protein SAY87_027657 [Trapa incisa]
MGNSPHAPLFPQAFGLGNDEFFQVPQSSGVSSVPDSKLLWSLPKLFNNEMRGASSCINHLQPMANTPTGYGDIPHPGFEQQLEQSKKHQHEMTQLYGRKRQLEAKEEKVTHSSGRKMNKKIGDSCSVQQLLPRVKKSTVTVCEIKVTGKRSQKIGDRVTALHQLVSPYGKTDTASVLQEASLHIKLLQDQIKMLSISYNSVRSPQVEEIGKKQTDLRNRGLCLVAVSSIQEGTKETKADDHSIHQCAP